MRGTYTIVEKGEAKGDALWLTPRLAFIITVKGKAQGLQLPLGLSFPLTLGLVECKIEGDSVGLVLEIEKGEVENVALGSSDGTLVGLVLDIVKQILQQIVYYFLKWIVCFLVLKSVT